MVILYNLACIYSLLSADLLANLRGFTREAAEKWIAENPGAKQPWDREDFTFPPPI